MLPGYYDEYWSFGGVAAAEGYAFLHGFPRHAAADKVWPQRYFTVEFKTLLIEPLYAMEIGTYSPDFLYASFPPSFAPPSI